MSLLTIRDATEADLPLLARMNKRLIEDEGSRNPMRQDALQERIHGWMLLGWQIVLFLREQEVVGYAVYQPRQEPYEPDRPLVFIRHFYIERKHRHQGLGRQAFSLLVEEQFPAGCRVALEVLASNPLGQRFWERLGFRLYATTMHWGQAGE
ncbi:MAG TPA: GNAT family N-acetyltransferase [Chthonomonadaceae bacterium]|nr:GNAT family N-acetyltransferase [Chthonomonadaceae bacterium]